MIIKAYTYLTIDQKLIVQKLWNEQYPKQLNFKSIDEFDLYLLGLEDVLHYLILNNNEEILGWAFKFSRHLQRWFVIILSNTIHGKGYGSKMLQKIIKNEVEIHGWVVDKDGYTKSDGTMYKSPLEFYHKNGFISILHDRLETQDLSAVKITYTIRK